MKKYFALIILVMFGFFTASTNTIYAKSNVNVGFHAGLSIPSDEMGNFYNRNDLNMKFGQGNSMKDSLGTIISDGMSLGYNLMAKVRIEATESMDFTVGFGINRFPESRTDIVNPENTEQIWGTIISTQNVIPISAGMMWNFLDFKIMKFNLMGEFAYNYVGYSYDFEFPNSNITLPTQPQNVDNRIGAGVGLGVDIDLVIVYLNVELKYNRVNMIRVANEAEKNFYNLSVGFVF